MRPAACDRRRVAVSVAAGRARHSSPLTCTGPDYDSYAGGPAAMISVKAKDLDVNGG